MLHPVNFEGLVAIVLALSIPIVAIVMVFVAVIKKSKHQKDVRKMIIENKTEPEVAKLLLDEPKKQKRKIGQVDVSSLRTACVLLGAGLGGIVNLLIQSCTCTSGIISSGGIYFWLIIALGVGLGLLSAFLVEMKLFKKYGPDKSEEDNQ